MFVYSLPVLFSHADFLQPIEFAVLLLSIAIGIWFLTPQPEKAEGLQYIHDDFLKAAWCGQKALWQVFWPFFVCLNALLFYLDSLARSGEFTVSSWDMAHFMLFTPIALWAISVWRCSSKCSDKLWAVLARIGVLSVYAEYLIKLLLRIDAPRVFFQCQEAMLDYSACF